MILYSLLLITVMIFKPSGLMGQYDFSLSRILEKVFNQKPAQEKTKGKAGEKNG